MNGWLGSGYKDECKLFVERHYFSAVYRFLPFEQRHSGEGGDTTSCTSGALYSPRSNWWERCFLMALQGIWAKSFTLLGPRRAILTAPETFRQSRPRRRFPRYRAAFESLVIVSRNEQPISWKDRASPLLVEEDEVFRTDPFMLAWFFSLFSKIFNT